jgi:hypothetical protein
MPLRDLRILVEQLSDGRAGLRLTPGHNLLEQLAELNLRGNLGLAGLPEPDLTTGQRVLPCVHPDTPGPRSVAALRDQRGLVATKRRFAALTSVREAKVQKVVSWWGGWGSNPRPADYEEPGLKLRALCLHG